MTGFSHTPDDTPAARALARPLALLLKTHAMATHTPPGTCANAFDYCRPCTAITEGAFVRWPCPVLIGAGFTMRDWGLWQEAFAAGVEQEYTTGTRARDLAGILADLDRCPHGRHEGDTCAGWRGPGTYDGGCRGGFSLGNPILPPGKVIGADLHRRNLYMIPVSRAAKATPEGWRKPMPPGHLLHDYARDEQELAAVSHALRAANQALLALGAGPFLPGVGQLDPIPVTGLDQTLDRVYDRWQQGTPHAGAPLQTLSDPLPGEPTPVNHRCEPFQLDEGETVTGGYGSPPPRPDLTAGPAWENSCAPGTPQ